MKITWRNREPCVALMFGPLVALATGLTLALGIILDEAGGSLIRGWKPGLGYLGFHGIILIPIMVEYWAIGDYRQIFEKETEGVEFYVNDRGTLGGYSPNGQRFRIYCWPPITR